MLKPHCRHIENLSQVSNEKSFCLNLSIQIFSHLQDQFPCLFIELGWYCRPYTPARQRICINTITLVRLTTKYICYQNIGPITRRTSFFWQGSQFQFLSQYNHREKNICSNLFFNISDLTSYGYYYQTGSIMYENNRTSFSC